ncbi:preprotein translocase subunit SecD [Clostridium amylolyticum]|uniref:Protein translocase subunit SecD n=1 Tax=Clostridium amylolyticum TaxID=1121298 RepID=A0A1M6CW31_9CLOT|nr:protein translocase subunit SecD [Clostridium amylolyticum]SHI65093.1 preprotein translocase subunit SecD [Clostridium amylolyticum]
MKTKARSNIIFIVTVVLIALFSFIGAKGVVIGGYRVKSFEQLITKGLDLQGGVSVLLEIIDKEVKPEELERTKELLNLRVNKIGVSETVVTTEGNRRIRIDIPGMYDSQGIVDALSKTGKLTFKDPEGKEVLTGSDITKAATQFNEYNQPVIGLEMSEEGRKKFADATTKFVGQKISIFMDEDLLTDPVVEGPITQGKAVITGNRSVEEAKRIAGIINAGALPLEVKAASVRTVGPQLGANAFPNAVKAGMIGVLVVFIFMIAYYRLPGLLADIALTLYIILVLLAFSYIGVTLTLPGIAGFLLTIGMAVDANVLIFERIKEELRTGKSIRSSVDSGFDRALSSILDSNITTIIAGVVLYFLGSGAVKGFALTLIIGIVLSMFTAIIVTKFLVHTALNMGIMSKPELFGVKRG